MPVTLLNTGVRSTGSGGGITPSPTMIQHTASTTNLNPHLNLSGAFDNFVFTPQNAVRSGNCLVLGITYPHGFTPAITDNNGNTWPGSPSVTADAGTGNFVASIFVLPNANAGNTTITVGFGGGTQIVPFQYALTEFNNIVTTSPVNGTHGTAADAGPTLTAGSFTPGNNDAHGGNLIWSYFTAAQYTTIAQDPSAWAPGNSGTILDCNTAWTTKSGVPNASQYVVQTASAAINPTITATGVTSDTYNCVAIALKIGTAGTARAAGIHIDKFIHQGTPAVNFGDAPPSPLTLQLPATGNLRVLSITNDHATTLTVTDNESQTWTQAIGSTGSTFGALFYMPNRAPNSNLTVTITGLNNFFCSYRFYDISGAAAAPLSGATNATITGSGTVYNSMPVLTPTAAPGVVVSWVAFELGATVAVTGPTGATLGVCTYDNIMDADVMDNADGLGIFYYSTTATQTWNWTDTSGGQVSWSYAAAFKAA